ncbi:MAG: hypothetical protein MUF49_11440 [Oculatellaceae cyanobacterium Prado106]|jgi:hypothetical protein|nr:hypothetical protein [Oculatellaceae cyanobacterium Prado106]
MTVAQSAKPSSSDLTVTLKRLIALLEEDETDDYGILQPSQPAFKLAMRFIVEAYESLGESFPRASVSTDEKGGIRLTWSKLEPECEVRLICPADSGQEMYLYHELGDTYAIEQNVTSSTLVQWLRWLKPE